MSITFRQYCVPDDFDRIGDFLIENYKPGNRDGNWLQPTWEYMHTHPYLDENSLSKIGIWEDAGKIVGVVHYEEKLGEAFFELHANYTHLKSQLLDYAEEQLFGETESGKRYLHAFVCEFDTTFEILIKSRGYEKNESRSRHMSQLLIPQSFRPVISLQAGFQLKSIADDNDLFKINRVLWRGFNHPGEPPVDGLLEERKKMQSGPHFRKDLTVVIEAPNGEFVSYCGTWYEAQNQIAYVEPVATDPDFRRMGLGKAVVIEGIRRCSELGARIAFVGSDQLFYQALGFKKVFTSHCWTKGWE